MMNFYQPNEVISFIPMFIYKPIFGWQCRSTTLSNFHFGNAKEYKKIKSIEHIINVIAWGRKTVQIVDAFSSIIIIKTL